MLFRSRRFNRSRYDAEAVVAAFNARLRHTVDLDAVRLDLLGVVHEAFQPTQVSMWTGDGPERPGILRGVIRPVIRPAEGRWSPAGS